MICLWTAVLIRIIICLADCCTKDDGSKGRRKCTVVVIMLGLLINAALAVTVFVFTQTQRDLDGGITLQVPENIFEDKYNDQRYFQVSRKQESLVNRLPSFCLLVLSSSSSFCFVSSASFSSSSCVCACVSLCLCVCVCVCVILHRRVLDYRSDANIFSVQVFSPFSFIF